MEQLVHRTTKKYFGDENGYGGRKTLSLGQGSILLGDNMLGALPSASKVMMSASEPPAVLGYGQQAYDSAFSAEHNYNAGASHTSASVIQPNY